MSRSHGGDRQYKPLLTVRSNTFYLLPSPPLSLGVVAVLDIFCLPVPCKTTFRHHSAVGQPVRLLDPGGGRGDHPPSISSTNERLDPLHPSLFSSPYSLPSFTHRNSRRSFSQTMPQNIWLQTRRITRQTANGGPPGSRLVIERQYPRDWTYTVKGGASTILLRRSP